MFLAIVAAAVLNQASPSTTTEVLVLTTATELPRTYGRTGRAGIEIQNLGPNDIFCAFTAATAVVNKARRIAAKPATGAAETWAIDAKAHQRIFCIAATANQITAGATVVSELVQSP